MPDTLAVTLTALRTRITGVFPGQIRAAVADLSDEQIWWRPNESSNSIGNLIAHLTGSLNHFLNRNLGGIPFDRDRPAEFAERRLIPKAELLERFDGMVSSAERTLAGLTVERLGDPSTEPSMHDFVIEDLLNIALHLSTHTGQIVWIAKMLAEGQIREVWVKSHMKEGVWKPAPGR